MSHPVQGFRGFYEGFIWVLQGLKGFRSQGLWVLGVEALDCMVAWRFMGSYQTLKPLTTSPEP